MAEKKKTFAILAAETTLPVPIYFSVQNWSLATADKLMFNIQWCHDEAFLQKRKYDKKLFPVFCRLCGKLVTFFIMLSLSTKKALLFTF